MIPLEALVVLPVVLPLLAAALLHGPVAPAGRALLPVAPLALLLPLHPEVPSEGALPWLLLGMRLGVDAVGEALLVLSALVGSAAGLYAVAAARGDPRRNGLLTALAGTLAALAGVLLAADLASFYFAYAAMTLAAYPLVTHFRTPEAFRAGRVYLGMAILAEGAVLSAVLLIAMAEGNPALAQAPELIAQHPYSEVVIVLLLLGFGVKAGVVPLHAWLPLAHPAAPVPASALLSALLVKAAVVAWWRLLPLGEAAFPALGVAVVAAGLASAAYANAVGITQRRAKTVLAYSTISQMGLLTALMGTALAQPAAAPVALAASLLFVLHHGLAKGALFLGVGLGSRARGWYLLLPALTLVGVPPLSGLLAKGAAKGVGSGVVGDALEAGLWAVSVLTALLMARLLTLAWRGGASAGEEGPQRLVVAALVALSVAVPWLAGAVHLPEQVAYAWRSESLEDALAPAVSGGLLAAALLGTRAAGWLPRIPEGDWIKPAMLCGVRAGYRLRRGWRRLPPAPQPPSWTAFTRLSAAIESRLLALTMAGALFLALVLGISLIGVLMGR